MSFKNFWFLGAGTKIIGHMVYAKKFFEVSRCTFLTKIHPQFHRWEKPDLNPVKVECSVITMLPQIWSFRRLPGIQNILQC